MPGYTTHVKVNLSFGLPLALIALKYGDVSSPKQIICFTAAFIYGTFFLHPDLDLARNVRLFSWKGLFTLPFRPYSYLFRHRGISHIPVIGTITRIVWLIIFFGALFYCLDWAFPNLANWNTSATWFAIGGIATADFFHVLLDRLK